MSRRSYVFQLEQLEPVILSTLQEQPSPLTLHDLRERVLINAAEQGVAADIVRAAIMRLWEADKVKVSADRRVELAESA